MKILQVVHSLPFLNQAGAEIYTHSLSRQLNKQHEVYIFSRICDEKQPEYCVTERNVDGLTVYLVNNTFKECNSFEAFYKNAAIDERFAQIVDRVRPDIVHVQSLVFLSAGILKKAKEKSVPVVFTLHDYWLACPKWHLLDRESKPCDKAFPGRFDKGCCFCLGEILNISAGPKSVYHFCKRLIPPLALAALKRVYFFFSKQVNDHDENIRKLEARRRYIKSILDGVDLFISPSRHLKERFIEFGIPEEKIKIINNGIDRVPGRKDGTGKGRDKIRFAFIGTILPAKGLHVLIEAFNAADVQNTVLDIYGSLRPYNGFEHYLGQVRRIVKNKNINFHGEFSRDELAKIFHETDILVVPSLWEENCPLVIQEAFYFRKPVIASNIGGIPEFIKDKLNGYLFNSGDSGELRAIIERIGNDPTILKDLEDNIPLPKSIEDNTCEIEAIYRRLIGKTP